MQCAGVCVCMSVLMYLIIRTLTSSLYTQQLLYRRTIAAIVCHTMCEKIAHLLTCCRCKTWTYLYLAVAACELSLWILIYPYVPTCMHTQWSIVGTHMIVHEFVS